MSRRAFAASLLTLGAVAAVLTASGALAEDCCNTTRYKEYQCLFETPPARWEAELVTVGQRQFLSPGYSMWGRETTCFTYTSYLCSNQGCPGGGSDCCRDYLEECPLAPPQCNGYLPPADREGWVWADGRAGTYTPYAAYSHNSSGGENEVSNPAVGRFLVRFPGLGGRDGNVQVVAYGSSNNRCKVATWNGMPYYTVDDQGTVSTGPGDLTVDVRCHTPAGAPVNTPFVVQFLASDDIGTSSSQIGYSLYVSGVQPGPGADAYRWNSAGPRPTTTRLDKGYYKIRFDGQLHSDASVIVTAVGTSATFCQTLSSSSDGTGADVWVLCYDPAGNLTDSSFSLRYEWRRPSTTSGQTLDGYLLASSPSSSSYTPVRQFNASGARNTASRSGTGLYSSAYPNLSAWEASSTVMVSANALGPSYCKPYSWLSWNGLVTVNTRCFNYAGVAGDRQYSQVFLSRQPYLPVGP